ncbi:MAG TPA: chorismate synthase, partial [Spirochaetia bacterium]|nr:chorismate synthase [Spirochaetia bacterium]
MPGSSFGRLFSVTTFGESHGPAIGVIVDGVPAGMLLQAEDIQRELNRRRPGQSAITTPRAEKDKVEILSGVFEGCTMGTPISLLIRNEEKKSSDYEALKEVFRPGHADYTYRAKFGVRDWRGGGRSSGRETATRVAAGAIAKKVLAARGISVFGYSLEIGGVRATRIDPAEIEKNPVRSPDGTAAELMVKAIEEARAAGDSIGGTAEVVASGCPAGLGDPVFDKLEALLAHALMSVGAVRGVEVGAGFAVSRMRGSAYNDEPYLHGGRVLTRTNNAGGITGGIS